MKIVMDFDGVFTDPTREGARCKELFRQALFTEGGLPEPRSRDLLAQAEALLRIKPFDFGWRWEGRLSAFGTEDPLIESIGVGDVFDHWANTQTDLAEVRKRLGLKAFTELSNQSFQKMSTELAASGGAHADPDAISTVRAWIQAGHDVRVVSNSDISKLRQFFHKAGLDEGPNFGFRGGARKFELGPTAQSVRVGEMNIHVDRPRYKEVLESERPDVVVGDGISLDLSAPLSLSDAGLLPKNIKLLVRRRPYTPAFTQAAASADPRFTLCDGWAQAREKVGT